MSGAKMQLAKMHIENQLVLASKHLKPILRFVESGYVDDEREFLPAALEIIETPASPAGRSIGFLIIAAAMTALIWATFSKLDIITSAPGRITSVGRSKIVQPFQAGIVRSILVNDGDHVQAGQVLIVLDPTAVNADAVRTAQDFMAAALDRSRLEGLRAVAGTDKPPVLLDLPPGATAEEIATANAQMQSQALEEAGKIADIDQQIAEKQFEVQQAVATIAKVTTDRPYLAQVAAMRSTLLKDQVGSKLDWLTAQQQLADEGPNLSLAQAEENSAQANVASLQQARAETQAEYTLGLMKDLEQADQKADELGQDLIKADQQVALTRLTAPITGTVQQLSVHTIGGVVTPAQALLTIVPDSQQLIVEASIKNQDIGFVHVGQDVQLKVSAFDFTRFGAIDGTVVSISHDVVDQAPGAAPANDGYAGTDEFGQDGANQTNGGVAPQAPEYVAEIALSETAIDTDEGASSLQPGMAVTADIETGRRRVISYLFSPLARLTNESGHER